MKVDIYTSIVHGILTIGSDCNELFKLSEPTLLMYDLQMTFQNWLDDFNNDRFISELTNQFQKINDDILKVNKNIEDLDSYFFRKKIETINFSKESIVRYPFL